MNKFFSRFISLSLGVAMMIGAAIGVSNSKGIKEVDAALEHAFVPYTAQEDRFEENNYILCSGWSTLGNSQPTGANSSAISPGSTEINPANDEPVVTSKGAIIHRLIRTSDNYYNIYNEAANKYIGTRDSLTGMHLYDTGSTNSAKWILKREYVGGDVHYAYTFENLGKKNSSDPDRQANRFLRVSPDNGLWWVGPEGCERSTIQLRIETPVYRVKLAAKNSSKVTGSKLAYSDLDINVYWDDTHYTRVINDYTLLVNYVPDGAIEYGDNLVKVYYRGVGSNEIHITGTPLHATTVNLSANTAMCYAPGETCQLSATMEPENTTDSIVWSSLDPDIATVDQNGLVTAVQPGTARIKASADSVDAQCLVTVHDYQKIEFNFKDNHAYAIDYPDDDTITIASLSGYELNFMYAHNTNGYGADGVDMPYDKSLVSNHTPIPGAIVGVTYNMKVNGGWQDGQFRVICSNSEITRPITSGGETFTNNPNYTVAYDKANNYHFFGFSTYEENGIMEKVKVFYEPSTIKEDIGKLKTQTALAYHYEGDKDNGYTYSNMVMRFGGRVSKELWNELNSIYEITGFGVVIAQGNKADTQSEMADLVNISTLSTFSTDIETNDAIDYFVPIEDMDTIIGQTENEYFWNLRFETEQDYIDYDYSAVAYIKLGDEYLLMDMVIECVRSLALDYLDNRGYGTSAAAASLQYLVENA